MSAIIYVTLFVYSGYKTLQLIIILLLDQLNID